MRDRSRAGTIAVAGLLLVYGLVSGVAFASSESGPQNGTIAKRIHLEKPKYPRSARSRSREGWVTISFVVDTDGLVKDAVVDDSSGGRAFETAAIGAVEEWRYEAASLDGQPVEQCHNQVQMNFQMEGAPGAGHSFLSKFREAGGLIEKRKFTDARRAIANLEEKDGLNLYEAAHVSVLRALLARKGPNRERELRALRRAVYAGGGEFLEAEASRRFLSRKFELEVNAHLYMNALMTFEVFRAKAPGGPPSPEMEALVEQIKALRETSQSFAVAGSIERPRSEGADLGVWFHWPLHREIAFDDPAGSIDHFELRCSWRRFRATPEPGQSWRMPDSWGNCGVLVFAKAGTSFELVEFGPERIEGP